MFAQFGPDIAVQLIVERLHLAPESIHLPREVVGRHLHQRCALHVAMRNQVERDVDAAGLSCHGVRMRVDCPFVERIELCHMRHAARGTNSVGNSLEFSQRPTGEKHAREFRCESARDGTSDRTTAAIDDRAFVFEQHVFNSPLLTSSGSGEPAVPRRQSLLRSCLAARSFPRRPPA